MCMDKISDFKKTIDTNAWSCVCIMLHYLFKSHQSSSKYKAKQSLNGIMLAVRDGLLGPLLKSPKDHVKKVSSIKLSRI